VLEFSVAEAVLVPDVPDVPEAALAELLELLLPDELLPYAALRMPIRLSVADVSDEAELLPPVARAELGPSRAVTRLSWFWLWMRLAAICAAVALVSVVEVEAGVAAGVAL
jgi:hypothetical protein